MHIITLCESILENPRAILLRQLDKAKGDLINRLKAEGVQYDERMAELEKVTYPRPKKEWIWQTFDEFIERHPWVSTENIRVKSIVREMIERYISFEDYVKDYGMQRMEGVLLRYVSQAYKTLMTGVPDALETDDVVDARAFLRAMLARVDSSLVSEWEHMRDFREQAPDDPFAEVRARAPDTDPRAFRARIRAELHQLVRELSRRDYEAALRSIRHMPDSPWTADTLESGLADFYEDYEAVLFNHAARLSDKTIMREDGHRRWAVTQKLVDPEGDNLWCLEGVIDLNDIADDDLDGPLTELVSIGV